MKHDILVKIQNIRIVIEYIFSSLYTTSVLDIGISLLTYMEIHILVLLIFIKFLLSRCYSRQMSLTQAPNIFIMVLIIWCLTGKIAKLLIIQKQENFLGNKEKSAELRCGINPLVWQQMLVNLPTYEEKLKATEMWFCRRILRNPWLEQVSNEEVRK